jgi:hypothetical protein
MYHVRPIILHFVLWLLLAPIVLVELRAFEQVHKMRAVDRYARVAERMR